MDCQFQTTHDHGHHDCSTRGSMTSAAAAIDPSLRRAVTALLWKRGLQGSSVFLGSRQCGTARHRLKGQQEPALGTTFSYWNRS